MTDPIIVDAKLISHLEELSCLTLTDDEKQRLTKDLVEILNGMARLGELNTENTAGRSHPFDYTNAFREDELQASFDRELILTNAPDSDGEVFIAPKTII